MRARPGNIWARTWSARPAADGSHVQSGVEGAERTGRRFRATCSATKRHRSVGRARPGQAGARGTQTPSRAGLGGDSAVACGRRKRASATALMRRSWRSRKLVYHLADWQRDLPCLCSGRLSRRVAAATAASSLSAAASTVAALAGALGRRHRGVAERTRSRLRVGRAGGHPGQGPAHLTATAAARRPQPGLGGGGRCNGAALSRGRLGEAGPARARRSIADHPPNTPGQPNRVFSLVLRAARVFGSAVLPLNTSWPPAPRRGAQSP